MAKNKASGVHTSRVVASDPTQPSGKNLYIDKKRRLIYVSPLLHQALYVPRSAYKKFNFYRIRFLLGVAVFLVLTSTAGAWFSFPLWGSLLISLLAFAALEYAWYQFLKTLTVMKSFDPAKAEPTLLQFIPVEMRNRCWLRVVLYSLLGILLVVNAYQQNYDPLMLVACYAAMAWCLYTAIQLAVRLVRSSKS